jgi:hypothetical protein
VKSVGSTMGPGGEKAAAQTTDCGCSGAMLLPGRGQERVCCAVEEVVVVFADSPSPVGELADNDGVAGPGPAYF